jgi:hypothetical protein
MDLGAKAGAPDGLRICCGGMASLRRPVLCQLLLALAVSVPTSVRAAGFDGPTATTPAGTFNGESPAAAAAAHSMSAPCAHTADAVARRQPPLL